MPFKTSHQSLVSLLLEGEMPEKIRNGVTGSVASKVQSLREMMSKFHDYISDTDDVSEVKQSIKV